MYLLYSLLTLVVFVVVSPYFLYQAIRHDKYIGSLAQRLGYLPISFNVDGDESIWIHAVSVGEALTARALAADLKARYPRLRLFLSTTTIPGQQVAQRSLQHVDAVFYFPFDWTFIVAPHAQSREAAPLHHDGDRDLAEPAARVPRARRQDRDDQRTDLVAIVSALPTDPAVLSAACSPTSIASACRATSRRGAWSISAPIRRASP